MRILSRFLPRDAMHKRGLCRHAVSVRPSVTFVDCIKTNKCIFKKFSPSSTQAILVFPCQTVWFYDNTLTETPLNGASNAGGVGRNRDSEPISGFTSCCKPFHRQVQIHLAATDYGEFITLVAGKRRSLLIAENNDEVYDKKPQLYAEDNVTRRQW